VSQHRENIKARSADGEYGKLNTAAIAAEISAVSPHECPPGVRSTLTPRQDTRIIRCYRSVVVSEAGMAQTAVASPGSGSGRGPVSKDLKRSIGFWGLMFISLGSIIGSGWLLGALFAAEAAGPASLLSWILAAVLLMVLALIHAELGAAYPVAGGTARFPYFAFGALAGFTAG